MNISLLLFFLVLLFLLLFLLLLFRIFELLVCAVVIDVVAISRESCKFIACVDIVVDFIYGYQVNRLTRHSITDFDEKKPKSQLQSPHSCLEVSNP